MKHALLVWLIQAMQRKDAGFLLLDTHAGIGRYDLDGVEASRTGEWRGGIGRLRARAGAEPALAAYLGLIDRLGLYPGSPLIAAAMLRPQDRLIACELHPADQVALRACMAPWPRAAVHLRDGYEAVGAFLPPPERRALVLIDPPFERADEFSRLLATLRLGLRKCPGAVFAVWYPIKHRAPVRSFQQAVAGAGLRDVVAAELLWREPVAPDRLNGSGLLLVNPPWRFEEEAAAILAALAAGLCDDEPGAGHAITRITAE